MVQMVSISSSSIPNFFRSLKKVFFKYPPWSQPAAGKRSIFNLNLNAFLLKQQFLK